MESGEVFIQFNLLIGYLLWLYMFANYGGGLKREILTKKIAGWKLAIVTLWFINAILFMEKNDPLSYIRNGSFWASFIISLVNWFMLVLIKAIDETWIASLGIREEYAQSY